MVVVMVVLKIAWFSVGIKLMIVEKYHARNVLLPSYHYAFSVRASQETHQWKPRSDTDPIQIVNSTPISTLQIRLRNSKLKPPTNLPIS